MLVKIGFLSLMIPGMAFANNLYQTRTVECFPTEDLGFHFSLIGSTIPETDTIANRVINPTYGVYFLKVEGEFDPNAGSKTEIVLNDADRERGYEFLLALEDSKAPDGAVKGRLRYVSIWAQTVDTEVACKVNS